MTDKNPTCEECMHVVDATPPKAEQRMLECRRYPPSIHLIPVPSPLAGGQPQIMKQSGFPNCFHRCGEFRAPVMQPQNLVGRRVGAADGDTRITQ